MARAPRYASYREAHPHAEHALRDAALLRSIGGPHHAAVSDDVRFGLRRAGDSGGAPVALVTAATGAQR